MSHNATSRSSSSLTTGVISASLLQPADLLKTRLQQDSSRARLLPTLRNILSQGPQADGSGGGWRSLWRGTAPSVLRTGFGSAIYFSTLNRLRTSVAAASSSSTAAVVRNSGNAITKTTSTLPHISPTANLLTGALARATAGLIMMPVTILKVRYESSLYTSSSAAAYGSKGTSMLGAARAILAQEGVRGFFSGWGATAIRDAPYAGLYVLVYEECKDALSRSQTSWRGGGGASTPTTMPTPAKNGKSSDGSKILITFTSGLLAAIVATAVTNPFDAIKTRLQLQPGRYGNLIQAGSMMVRAEGWRSLFDGFGLRVGRKAVGSALAWTGYEEFIRRVESRVVDR